MRHTYVQGMFRRHAAEVYVHVLTKRERCNTFEHTFNAPVFLIPCKVKVNVCTVLFSLVSSTACSVGIQEELSSKILRSV